MMATTRRPLRSTPIPARATTYTSRLSPIQSIKSRLPPMPLRSSKGSTMMTHVATTTISTLSPALTTLYPIGLHWVSQISFIVQLTIGRLLVDFVRVCRCSQCELMVGLTHRSPSSPSSPSTTTTTTTAGGGSARPTATTSRGARRGGATPVTISPARRWNLCPTPASTNQKPPFLVGRTGRASERASERPDWIARGRCFVGFRAVFE